MRILSYSVFFPLCLPFFHLSSILQKHSTCILMENTSKVHNDAWLLNRMPNWWIRAHRQNKDQSKHFTCAWFLISVCRNILSVFAWAQQHSAALLPFTHSFCSLLEISAKFLTARSVRTSSLPTLLKISLNNILKF